MTLDPRFGLPLSLPEALRADPAPVARQLADLIEGEGEGAPAYACRRRASARPWQAALTGLALCVGLGAQSYAAPASQGLEGRWVMSPARSIFEEAVTGPAPDAATLTVTRDDARQLAYQLVERRDGEEVGRGAYTVSFGGGGASSVSSVDGERLAVVARREAGGAIAIEAPAVDGRQASIHLRRTGADTAVLEHDVSSPAGVVRLETIALVRAAPIAGE